MVSLTLSVNSVHFAEKRLNWFLDLTDKNDLNTQISKYIHQFDLKDVGEIRDRISVSRKQVTWTKSFEGTNCCQLINEITSQQNFWTINHYSWLSESTMYPANLLLRLRLTFEYETAGCIEISPLYFLSRLNLIRYLYLEIHIPALKVPCWEWIAC